MNAAVAGKLSNGEKAFEEKARSSPEERNASTLAQLGIGITCRKGCRKGPVNQDDFFTYCVKEFGLYGVFDGHGAEGHIVANFVQWHFPSIIRHQLDIHRSPRTALRRSFFIMDRKLHECSRANEFDSKFSGTTASVVLHKRKKNKLYVAHVGDSRVVLARRGSCGQLEAVFLTKDHKPDDPLEKNRIEVYGGEVRRPEGHIPHRVYLKGQEYPGLAMSRSLGDRAGHAVGVTSEPDVSVYNIVEGTDVLLIMCSDGVWEFITNQEAVDIVSCFPLSKAGEAATALSVEARKRWNERDGYTVDDITVQIVHLFAP